jgi:predicted lipid-binding transport protein (Tim44 family)
MARASDAMRGRPGAGIGCLGSLAVGVLFVLGLIFFIGALVFIAGVFLVAMVVAVIGLGMSRLLTALSPRYRDRRATEGAFRPTTKVIETTAKVIDSTKPKRRN